jgi:tetratricopeptide (TPR) repeat protein
MLLLVNRRCATPLTGAITSSVLRNSASSAASPYSAQGEYDKACSCAEEGLALFQELEDNQGISYALFRLGRVLFVSQSGKAAVAPLLEECLALMRGGGSMLVYAETHWLLADFALSQGDSVTARSHIEKSLAFSRTTDQRPGIPDALFICGRITAAQGDYAAAQALYEESLALARELGFKIEAPSLSGSPGRCGECSGSTRVGRTPLGRCRVPT